MKAILEFNLEDVDDRQKHLRAVLADDAFDCLWSIEQHFRNTIKELEEKDVDDSVFEAINALQEEFYSTLQMNGIDLEKQYS